MRACWCVAGVAALMGTLANSAQAQDTQLHGFVDVTAATSDRGSDHSAFGLGQYDFYLTSKLAEKISFLGESVFEFDDDFVVDVERIVLTFEPSPLFRVGVGKHHTPFGFWNNAYHHGALMQPTIERPTMLLFEDDGGILPIHTTGLLLAGRDFSPLHLGYDVMIGNGIGSTPVSDNDDHKSLTVSAHSQITSVFSVGASGYFDHISPGSATLGGGTLTSTVSQRMLGGFLAYLSPTLEVLSEYQGVRNTLSAGPGGTTTAWYVYGGYRLGRLVPYFRYDQLDFPSNDPYFVPDDLSLSLIGARYDLAATATIKLEVRHRHLDSDGASTEVAAQAAIGF
jgi:hypothetical protein